MTRHPVPLASFVLLLLSACAADPPGVGTETGMGGIGVGTGGASATGGGGGGGGTGTGGTGGSIVVGPAPSGLHVVGTHIEDGQGHTVVLRGVNRSGTEYMCIQNRGIFDGPSDEGSVIAITSWKANAVRVPLNESCWLAISGAPAAFSGDAYKSAIRAYVTMLRSHGLIPILDLHWAAPGAIAATREQPMPNADHSPAFWTDVATTFADDDGVVFEPYNEPYPDMNRDTIAGWTCWRDGCTANLTVAAGAMAATYAATGMQALVTAIRSAGARNLILLGGLQFSNTLTQWLTYAPADPLANTGAAWHAYAFNACNTATCWDGAPAAVAAMVPVVATEFGERDCQSTFVTPMMQWFDAHTSGYLAWAWDAYGACAPYVSRTQPGQPWSLVGDYAGGAPNGGYAQAVHDHLAGL